MPNGKLYIVATPIGNLDDMTYRAVKILQQVSVIAAEDTRHSARLLQHYSIQMPMMALHEHNEKSRFQEILDRLSAGESVALISDAGTPLISDPGYRLVHEARAAGIEVIPIPGACAAITALCASGLPSDRFVFEGFLPAKHQARLKRLEELKTEVRTMIFYESPHRVISSLQDMQKVFGESRFAVMARELTKLFETIRGDQLANLLPWLESHTDQHCGEFVILVEGEGREKSAELADEDQRVLKILLKELSVKQASHLASEITGKKKNLLYQAALDVQKT